MIKRYKNVGFWIGLIGIVCTAIGIEPSTITSWDILLNNLMEVLKNPYMLVSVIMAITGVFVNPTTPGLKDNSKKEVE